MDKKRWPGTALRVLGTAVILASILWFVPFAAIVQQVAAARPGYVLAGIALSLVAALLEAGQMWSMLRRLGLPASLWAVFETKMVSRFYGQFMAGEFLGSAVKLHRLAGPTNRYSEVVAAMTYLRVINTLTLVWMGVVFVLIERPPGGGRWVGAALVAFALLLTGLQLLLASRHGERLALSDQPGRPGHWFVEKLRVGGRKAFASYRLFSESTWSMCAQSIVRHTLGLASFACLALSLDIHLSLLTIGWIRVVLQALLTLPISLSGVGLREGALVLLLQDYGVPAASAVALAFLIFAAKVLKNALGGLFEARSLLLPASTRDPTI